MTASNDGIDGHRSEGPRINVSKEERMMKKSVLVSALVLGAGAIAAPAHAQNLDCSGNWMMTTDQGHVFVGQAVQNGYQFEWTGKSQSAAMTLRGSLDPSTGNVNLFRSDRPDILFQGRIEPNCGQIRGSYKISREAAANHYVLTRTQAASGATPIGASVQLQDQAPAAQSPQQATIGASESQDSGGKGFLRSLLSSDGERPTDIKNDRLRK